MDTPLHQQSAQSRAATSGIAAQNRVARRIFLWRTDMMGSLIVGGCTPGGINSVDYIEPIEVSTDAKPDVAFNVHTFDGLVHTIGLSHKNINSQMTDKGTHAHHHAGRIHFQKAQLYGLWDENHVELAGIFREHFIDGNPIGNQSPQLQQRVTAHLADVSRQLIGGIICGVEGQRATHLSVSQTLSDSPQGIEREILLGIWPATDVVNALCSAPFTLNSAKDGHVGVIGNGLFHLQRGKSLNAGPQTDIQAKINVSGLVEMLKKSK